MTVDTNEVVSGKEFVGAIEFITRASIPVYSLDRRRSPVPIGSGFFLGRAGSFFFVSAAHLLPIKHGEPLYYYDRANEMQRLSGQILAISDQDTDVGIMKLGSPPFAVANDSDRLVLPSTYLKPNSLPRAGKQFAFIGFPNSKTKVSKYEKGVFVTTYNYHDHSIADDEYEKLGLDARDHIALHLKLKEVYDQAGRRINFPRPTGMSGCPVWELGSDFDERHEATLRLVGVGTRYLKNKKLIVGTDVSHVLRLLDQIA